MSDWNSTLNWTFKPIGPTEFCLYDLKFCSPNKNVISLCSFDNEVYWCCKNHENKNIIKHGAENSEYATYKACGLTISPHDTNIFILFLKNNNEMNFTGLLQFLRDNYEKK